MNFLKNNFLYVIIFVLSFIVLLQRCGKSKIQSQDPIVTVKIDTLYKDTIIYQKAKPGKKEVIKDTSWLHDTIYNPPVDTTQNCLELHKKYVDLGNKYYSKNIQTTNFQHKYGTIKIVDTVTKNEIIGSELTANLVIPEVTKTVTIEKTLEPKRQVYVGAGLYGNQIRPISMANVGLLYKDKKDRIYQVNIGYNGQVQYGVSTFWKLKLK